jgi:hypothetical protein
MPVYLDAIPDVAPRIPRPVTRHWLYLLGAMMVLGNVLVFWLWTQERSGFVFWFMASGLPFCLWGLLFSMRRFGYKCDQVWAASWNRERKRLLDQEITRGQRAARVLHAGVITQLGNGAEKLLIAVKSSEPQLRMQIPRMGDLPVRHSRLPGFADKQQSQDLDTTLKTIASQVKPVLAKIPTDVLCWLMVDCDIAGVSDADEQIHNMITAQTDKTFRLVNMKGFTAFDFWLDEIWKQPAVLLAISAVIRAEPQDDEGEAMTWTLLLNRDHSSFPNAVKLHRPQKGSIGTLSQVLGRALLWSQISVGDVKGAWTTGNAPAQGGEWSGACEENGLTFSMTEDNRDVDQTTGYTGKAAPWLAVNLAVTMAQQDSAQVVVAETNPGEIWVVSITPAGKTGINQDLS